MRFTLPGEPVEFPLAIGGNAESLDYQWVTVADSVAVGEPMPLTAERPIAPKLAGFYHIAIVRGVEADDRAGADARRDGALRPEAGQLAERLPDRHLPLRASRPPRAARDACRVRRGPARAARALAQQAPQARRLRDARRPGQRVAEVRRAQSAPARQARAGAVRSRRRGASRAGGRRALGVPLAVAQPRGTPRGAATAGTSTATRRTSRSTRTATAGSR